jgi:hypothetical protein
MKREYEHTSIHTRIDSHRRISSIYRMSSAVEFECWYWETFVWDGDKIIDDLTDSGIVNCPNDVVETHARYLKKLNESE